MRILFITDNFPPEVNAPATRTFEHCREWVQKGVEVTVITCFPNFPQGKVYKGYRNKFMQKEVVDGIKVIRTWSYINSNAGFLKRTLDYISFAFMSFWFSLFIKTDIIIGTSPQFFVALAAYCSSIFNRKKWIMEVRDLWPESIKAVGAMKDGRMFRLLERLELSLYRSAEKIVVVTDTFKENIAGRGITKDKIFVVKNGVDLTKYVAKGKGEDLKKKLGLEGKFIISYLGTHGMAHKLDFVLKSANHVQDESIQFLLIGDGAKKTELQELHKSLGLQNVTMLPPVSKAEIVDYIELSDIALVNLMKSDTFKTVIPSKIFENVAMQKPILIGVDGEARNLIEDYKAGLYYEPENLAEFLKAITKIAEDKGLYQDLQKGCLNLAKDFDRKVLANRMLAIIKE